MRNIGPSSSLPGSWRSHNSQIVHRVFHSTLSVAEPLRAKLCSHCFEPTNTRLFGTDSVLLGRDRGDRSQNLETRHTSVSLAPGPDDARTSKDLTARVGLDAEITHGARGKPLPQRDLDTRLTHIESGRGFLDWRHNFDLSVGRPTLGATALVFSSSRTNLRLFGCGRRLSGLFRFLGAHRLLRTHRTRYAPVHQ